MWDSDRLTHPCPPGTPLHSGDNKTDTKYCNSIVSSDGYTPIYNAHRVECGSSGKCEKVQCYEALCSYYACPNIYTPVHGADSIFCKDSGCTTELCCEKVGLNPEFNYTVSADFCDELHLLCSTVFL